MKTALIRGAALAVAFMHGAVASTTVTPQLLREQFQAASVEFSVPRELLETIAYLETGWQQSDAPAESAAAPDSHDDHGPAVHGVMALTEEAGERSVRAAASALGVKPELVRAESLQNIRGAAALLARLAKAEKLVAKDRELSAQNFTAWMRVVGQFSGLEAYKIDAATGKQVRNPVDEDRQRASYAEGVLLQLLQGFQVGSITSHAIDAKLAGPARIELRSRIDFLTPLEQLAAKLGKTDGGAEFPGAKFRRSPWTKAGGPAKTYIVIHSTEGAYAGAVNHLTSSRNRKRTSAHYVIRSADGEVTQLVSNADRASHACGRNLDKEYWNDVSIGIEHEGWANKRGWQTEALYKTSAKLVTFLMNQFKIPASNIISHQDAYQTQKQNWGGGCDVRTDPGEGWDWTYFRDLVAFFNTPPPSIGE